MTKPLIEHLASLVQARTTCIGTGNHTWLDKHTDGITALAKMLPSGAGIDHGTTIDLDKSNGSKIVLRVDFHHMDENGFYDGWTEHTLIVRPTFGGIDLTIGGRDRNGIKDYLADVYHDALTQPVEATVDGFRWPTLDKEVR